MAAQDRNNGTIVDVRFGASGITDLAAPTVSEVTALTAIECGFSTGPDAPRAGSEIDISGLCDQVDRTKPGNITQGPISGEMHREFDGTDAYWALFDDSNTTTQHFVICRAGFSGTDGVPAIGDVCEVYEVAVMVRSPLAPTRTDSQMFGFELSISASQIDVAIVA